MAGISAGAYAVVLDEDAVFGVMIPLSVCSSTGRIAWLGFFAENELWGGKWGDVL